MTHLQSVRRVLAALTAAVAAFYAHGLFAYTYDPPIASWFWVGALGGAPLLLLCGGLGPQLLGRALLWANLVLGTLLCLAMGNTSTSIGGATGIALASGSALLLLGTHGLDAAPDRPGTFAPVALRGTLVAILVMALADTVSLLFWGGVATQYGDHLPGVGLLVAGGVMALAVFGLYRLRVWGFVLNLVANLAIAALAWLLPSIPGSLRCCLTVTAVGQIGCGLPLLRALVRGGTPAAPMNARRVALLGTLIIVALVAVALIAPRLWPAGLG